MAQTITKEKIIQCAREEMKESKGYSNLRLHRWYIVGHTHKRIIVKVIFLRQGQPYSIYMVVNLDNGIISRDETQPIRRYST